MAQWFAIVGRKDPIFELDLSVPRREDLARAAQFIIHGALDMIDLQLAVSQSIFLKQVDRYNDQVVSAYVTPGGIKFLCLHDTSLRQDLLLSFFTETHEMYLKILLNPFYTPGTRIPLESEFHSKVKVLSKRITTR
jgi:trafficking protein particle complex subunit 2